MNSSPVSFHAIDAINAKILDLICEGHANKFIKDAVCLSIQAVETRISRMMDEYCQRRSRAELASHWTRYKESQK